MSNLNISRAQRLDARVIEQIPTITRSYAAKLIHDGNVSVNGTTITKPGHKLHPNDTVNVIYDESYENRIPDIEFDVLYEDDDCVVIYKPEGILTHSKGAFNPEATVATWLRGYINGMDGERAGIVHRLDRATSGVMICAKTPEALSWLQKQFAQRRTKKVYMAVVEGALKTPEAIIDMPIERNPKAPATFRVGANGKSAKTHYITLAGNKKYSLVELRPETGRTHQLRVHMKHIHHPILGDTLYGGKPSDRLFLHAASLEITLPNRTRQVFSAAVPKTFREKCT